VIDLLLRKIYLRKCNWRYPNYDSS